MEAGRKVDRQVALVEGSVVADEPNRNHDRLFVIMMKRNKEKFSPVAAAMGLIDYIG